MQCLEVKNQSYLFKLTALWAFVEVALGGMLHALRVPLTGVVVGGTAVAIISFLLAVITMFLIYIEQDFWAKIIFAISLLSLMISLILSLIEVQLSTKALSIQLRSMED